MTGYAVLMEALEFILLMLASLPFMYFGFAVFVWVWWKSCSWLFVWFVTVSERKFKKNSWQEKLFLSFFIGFGGIASIYLFIYLFIILLKESGF